MKILHVITSLRTGGAEHLMVDLLPALRALDNDVELLVLDGTPTPFMQQLEEEGVTIRHLGIGGSPYNPKYILGLCKYMRRYDVIHTHNTACQLFAPMARLLTLGGARLVTTEHNATNRRRGKLLFKLIDRWMYARYSRIICIAQQTYQNLTAHLGTNKNMTVIFNGVRVDSFLHAIKDVAKETEFVVSMIAGFRHQKDQDTLIRAMAQLPGNYCLQLVGDGPRRGELENLIAKLQLGDRVKLLGIRTDIPDILAHSDVVVLSSHWEGLSLSSIEGMASGCPFVASDVDGLREIVKGYGILFPHQDCRALASAIRQLCENPEEYRRVAERCQARAKQYDISLMAKKYNEVYQDLCPNK